MIRRAEERDIPRVLALLRQVNMVHHLGRPDLFRPETKYNADELRGIFSDPERPVFVFADGQDTVQGYAFCILQHPGNALMTDILTLYIDDLCVEEACRGQGIGRALYEHVRGYAKQIGCYNLTLNVWALNESALKFYQKCGLVPQKYGMETIL